MEGKVVGWYVYNQPFFLSFLDFVCVYFGSH